MRPRLIASEIPPSARLPPSTVSRFNEAEADRLGNLVHCNLLNSNSHGRELRALPILTCHGTAHRGVATSIAANKP